MNDELEKYFAGTLSATEKTEFLNKLRDTPEAKKEFARMKADRVPATYFSNSSFMVP